MEAFLGAEAVLENMGGRGEGLVDVAAPQPGVHREIGRLASLEMLEIGKAAGRPQLLVNVDRGGHGLHLVVDRGQFLVFRHDLVDRGFGDVGIGGHHHRDRLADEAHLVDRQDGLIVERGAVVGIGDHLADVVGGEDAMNAGNLLRGAGVDRLDPAMRHRAAEDLSVQHSRQPHGVRVFGASGDLLAGFEPRQRTADLPAGAHSSAPNPKFAHIVLRGRLRTSKSLGSL